MADLRGYKLIKFTCLLQGEHKTVLLKADGSEFTKRFQWDGPAAGINLKAAAAALQPQAADDFAAPMGSLSSQQAPGCDGCVGEDTRAAVSAAAAKKFPHTAIGALLCGESADPKSVFLLSCCRHCHG